MKYYCKLDSEGYIESTNLQLYSLTKAAEEWNKLIYEINEYGSQGVEKLTEQLVFITTCLGLSLSQLLGQNNPSPEKDKMGDLNNLFSNLLNKTSLSRPDKKRLNKSFNEMLEYYSAIRHLGKIKNNKHYVTIDELSIDKVEKFRQLTIEIWDIVISIHRKDENNEIENFRSIADTIDFHE